MCLQRAADDLHLWIGITHCRIQRTTPCLQVLEQVLSHLRQNLMFLHKLIDNVALLDVLCAFRVAVTESHGEFVKPNCMPNGPVAIVGGHHPLVESSLDGRTYQPNDTYLAGAYLCFQNRVSKQEGGREGCCMLKVGALAMTTTDSSDDVTHVLAC